MRTTLLFIAAACFAFFIGYQVGKATPCTDVEQFDINPIPAPK